MNRHGRTLGLIVLAAGVLRLWLFSGFVLGDDPAYASLVHHVLQDGYPPAIERNVFATRPLLIWSIAGSIAAFGWTELAFVLPILLSSLVCISAAYCIGALLDGRATGALAATTLALFPLDAVYATTLANDLMASAYAACGATLAVAAARNAHDGRGRPWLAAAGGVAIGLATAVKLSAVALGIPLIVIAGVLFVRARTLRRPAAAMVFGWIAAQAGIAVFFRLSSGDWFAHVRVETAFNEAYMLGFYNQTRADALWAYPKWAFIGGPGPVGHRLFPYGLFFPLAALSAVALAWWRVPRVWFVALWCGALLLFFEFWPLQISPVYVPIHRLPRFLHLAAVPTALLIGFGVREALRRRAVIAFAAGGVFFVYAYTSVDVSVAGAARHRDSMIDQRFAADFAGRYPGSVVADNELLNYLKFRDGYRNPGRFLDPLEAGSGTTQPALAIVGGARRVELDPAYVLPYAVNPVPGTWVRLAEMPGRPAPWRPLPGTIYVAPEGLRLPVSDGDGLDRAALSHGCPEGRSWALHDVLDIGNAASEAAHEYVIEQPSWSGRRMLLKDNGHPFSDDGRAFRGLQRFLVRRIPGTADICVAIRIDARVQNQATAWTVNHRPAGTLDASARPPKDSWAVKALVVRRDLLGSGDVWFEERFQSSDVDINAFRIEVFQEASLNGQPPTAGGSVP